MRRRRPRSRDRMAPGRLWPYVRSLMSALDHVRPWRAIERRVSRKIRVGSVEVGGDAPITVQSMTKTLRADAEATNDPTLQLEEPGADIVRASCPDEASTAALPQIVRASKVPFVA